MSRHRARLLGSSLAVLSIFTLLNSSVLAAESRERFMPGTPVRAPKSAAITLEKAAETTLGLKRCDVRSVLVSEAKENELTLTVDLAAKSDQSRMVTFNLAPYALRAPDFSVAIVGDDGVHRQIAVPAPASYHAIDDATGAEVWAYIVDGQVNATIAGAPGMDDKFIYIQPLPADEPTAKGAARDLLTQSATNDPSLHVIYRSDDIVPVEATCGVDHCDDCHGHADQSVTSFDPSFADRGPASCKTAELVIDCDFPFYQLNRSSITRTVQDVEAVILNVNPPYRNGFATTTFFRVKQIVVRVTALGDPYNAFDVNNTDPNALLTQAQSLWAGTPSPARDLVHLFTGRELTGSTIGLAYIGAVCNSSFGIGESQSRFSSILGFRGALTAHELGHNFSMNHDAGGDPTVMAPSIPPVVPTNFSAASISAYTAALPGYTCLNAATGDAVEDTAITVPGRAVTIDVLANDGLGGSPTSGGPCASSITTFTLTSPTSASGAALTLSPTGPGGRNVVIYTPTASAGTVTTLTDTFTYTAGSPATTAIVTVEVTHPRNRTAVLNPLGGLVRRITDLTEPDGSVFLFTTFPNYATEPQVGPLGVATTVSVTATFGRGNELTGFIEVPNADMYQFWLSGGDLARIYIGSELLTSNLAIGSTTETTATIALAAGKHPIRVDHVQYQPNASLSLSYAALGYMASPAFAKTVVPSGALKRGEVCRADFNGSGGVTADDIFAFLDAWFAQNGMAGTGLSADFNNSGTVTADDIFSFLDTWFAQNGLCS